MRLGLVRRASRQIAARSRNLARGLRSAASGDRDTRTEAAGDGDADERPIAWQQLFRELDSPNARVRDRAATVVEVLAPPSAIRPLVRAYLHHGDLRLLSTLGRFGPKVTLTVGLQALDTNRSPIERSRLLDILGSSGDPDAVRIVGRASADLEPMVRAAAGAALLELGEARGAEQLDRQLLAADPDERLPALRAAMRLDEPAALGVLEAHLERYLALGGAVPREVSVAMPMLIDIESELPGIIAEQLRRSRHALTLVIGPAARGLAERRRAALSRELPDHRLFFTTARHSPPEQFEVLLQARAAAAAAAADAAPGAAPRTRVALVGDLTSPQGIHPPPHFLVRNEGERLTVRIVLVGQWEFAVTMEWWYYIDDHAEVPTSLDVILTAHALGAEDMTEEELGLLRVAGPDRRDAFGRALLAHRTNV